MSALGTNSQTTRSVRAGRKRDIPVAVALILVGALAATAILLSAGFSRRPQGGSTVSTGGSCTLTGTTRAPGGTMTVCARYGVSGTGRVDLRSVLASYRSSRGYALPHFTVTIDNAVTGVLDDRVSGRTDYANAVRSYGSEFTAIRGSISAPATMVVTLTISTYGPAGPYYLPLASVALVLDRRVFPCPQPGTANPENGSSIPVC